MNKNNNKTPKDPTYPLAYQEQHTWFYGHKFIVTPSTLIPRPETEEIINATKALVAKDNCCNSDNIDEAGSHFYDISKTRRVGSPACQVRSRRDLTKCCKNDTARTTPLSELQQSSFAPKVLDVGTGSGIIAITLAQELPQAQITATDISPEALTVAKQNAKLHKTNITLVLSDLLKNISGPFDIITANLPYVDKTWHWLDHKALSHEPPQALFADDHGLKYIKDLIRQAPAHLAPKGILILEHDPCQLPEISAYATKHGFTPTPHSPYVTILSRPVPNA